MSDQEIIITGFGPFGDVSSNPTEKLVLSLKEKLQNKLYQIFVLPVSYSHCTHWSEKHITESTSLVIHFGVSAKSKTILLERTGRNSVGSSIDVNGEIVAETISENGPDVIETKLDLALVCQLLKDEGFKCELSDNAGDYLCNFIYYKSLTIAQNRSVFVHVPPEEEISIEELKSFTLALIRNLRSQVE